jgi:hypothetical protein
MVGEFFLNKLKPCKSRANIALKTEEKLEDRVEHVGAKPAQRSTVMHECKLFCLLLRLLLKDKSITMKFRSLKYVELDIRKQQFFIP